MPAGRPTQLNDELKVKIKKLILEGKNLKEVAKLCDIPYETMDGWKDRNYDDFDTFVMICQTRRQLNKAGRNIDDFLDMETKVTIAKGELIFEVDDVKKMKIKADMSAFVAETIGKQFYSKRTEITGKDGKPVIEATQEMLDEYVKELQSKEILLSGDKKQMEENINEQDKTIPMVQSDTVIDADGIAVAPATEPANPAPTAEATPVGERYDETQEVVEPATESTEGADEDVVPAS